jgi:stearoyl-CoA desaturase (Delta-9 desaturase)
MQSALALRDVPQAPPLLVPASPDLAPTTDAKSSPAAESSPIEWSGIIPFALCHLAALGAIWSGVTWQAVVLGIVLYWARIFGVTAGYHRYFSHRAFSTSRPFAFVLAFLAQSTMQKGVLWWASRHRHHHLYSDRVEDLHSPRQHGFLHAHLGWLFDGTQATDWKRVKDLSSHRELRFLNYFYLLPPIALGTACWLFFGWPGLFVGFFASTVCTWHGTFAINSLAHVWGKRRYDTKDDSRNNFWLALMTLGEGWHNNHHHHMQSARQGFFPGEIDMTYMGLRVLERLGLIWDLKQPPARVLAAGLAADRAREAASAG